ncbi:hypothetical protein [Nodosilinea sp. P-1105]|uniref:hypothetical protein n=1 Tax=Nodosilinea sp. P-1105 TaxID=2546229 RepID=UPI00146D050A|nr:hypothetical protein [Nodosilinea sp. P-1105]NMF85633.1 hypothetical protein [Nodosilinea sp. P-1105]
MAIIALKAWYLDAYEPVRELEKRPHDLRLSKNSLLKSALRADFLDDSDEVKQSAWFQRYLEGETVEFYIEGSGGYGIANIDLISHEIYFTKREVMAHLQPIIYFCYQSDFAASAEALHQGLMAAVKSINRKSRVALTLEVSHRLSEGPARLNSSLTRKIRQALLFVADGTPILPSPGEPAIAVPHPHVCVEMGYALQAKQLDQILLAQMERPDIGGQYPFDLPAQQRLTFKTQADLHKHLPKALEQQLARFNLWT